MRARSGEEIQKERPPVAHAGERGWEKIGWRRKRHGKLSLSFHLAPLFPKESTLKEEKNAYLKCP